MPIDVPNRLSKNDRNRGAELGIPPAGYRRLRGSGREGWGRRLAVITAGIGVVVLLLVVGWSLDRHSAHGVPVIEAQSGPVRVKPDNPGGLQVAGADDSILSGKAENGKAELAPPPESPEPQALSAQEQSANEKTAPPAPPAIQPPGPSTAAAPANPALAPAGREGAGQAHREAAPPAVPAAPAQAVPPSAAQATKPTPASTPAAGTAERSAGVAGRGTEVQLAAVRSEHAAKIEWGRLTKRMPSLFDGRRPAFVRAERDGHVFWRLRMGGFADTAQATAFCERVRAKGAGCSLATF